MTSLGRKEDPFDLKKDKGGGNLPAFSVAQGCVAPIICGGAHKLQGPR